MSMMDNIVNFSGGNWVKLEEVKSRFKPKAAVLDRLINNRLVTIVFEVIRNIHGEIIWYRAYSVDGMSYIDAAKFRKSLGPASALESYTLRKTA